MKLTKNFVSLEFKFVNNIAVNTDSRYIVGVSLHILQI